MKNFRVQIRSRGYCANFTLSSEDNETAFENALVDKLGQNDIVWEKDGFSNPFKPWVTYEEVIDATRSQGPLQKEEKSRDRMGGASA